MTCQPWTKPARARHLRIVGSWWASLAWAALYLAAVQGVFDRFHHDRDCVHPQLEIQAE